MYASIEIYHIRGLAGNLQYKEIGALGEEGSVDIMADNRISSPSETGRIANRSPYPAAELSPQRRGSNRP